MPITLKFGEAVGHPVVAIRESRPHRFADMTKDVPMKLADHIVLADRCLPALVMSGLGPLEGGNNRVRSFVPSTLALRLCIISEPCRVRLHQVSDRGRF